MVIAYLRERFPLHIYVPLAAVIASAGALPPSGGSLWPAFAGSLLLLLQFRLWDDLADRGRDAVEHPARVLVRHPDVTQAIGLCGALAVLNICLAVWRDASGVAVAVLAALDVTFGAWYLARGARSAAGEHLVLAKYPAMVAIVAGDRVLAAPLPVLAVAALLYVGVWVYEACHDRTSPLARYVSFGGHS